MTTQPTIHHMICQIHSVGMPNGHAAGSVSLPRTANGPMAKRNHMTARVQIGFFQRRRLWRSPVCCRINLVVAVAVASRLSLWLREGADQHCRQEIEKDSPAGAVDGEGIATDADEAPQLGHIGKGNGEYPRRRDRRRHQLA